MPRNTRVALISLISLKLAFLLTLAAFLFGCANPLNFRKLMDGPEGEALIVTPSSGSLSGNATVLLSVRGGHPPYEYALVEGSGALSGAHYTAPAVNSNERIEVRDSVGNTAQASFTIDVSGLSLGIFPTVLTVYQGDSIDFSHVGGTGPYEYSIVGVGPPPDAGTVNLTSGLYVAGSDPGTYTVRITDTFDSSTADAAVTVEAKSFAISPSAITLTIGDTFDFNEVGGTGSFSWSIPTNTTGAIIDATGAYTAGSTTGTDVVRVTDTYDGRTRDATVTVQASSFTTNVNYTLAGTPAVTAVGGGVRTGTAVTASATIENIGTAPGAQDIAWSAYASTDTTIGGSDYLIDSGVIAGGIAASGTQPISISGAWPDVPGSYYVLITIAASDDLALANNSGQSEAATTISKQLAIGPATATIYTGQSIGFTGDGIGPFTYAITTNGSGGTIDSATGAYTAGSSAGTDTIELQDSDLSTVTATVTVQSLPAPPAASLNYYPLDSMPTDTTPPEGAPMVESFTIHNAGPDDGTEDVVWLAYLSTDSTISSDDDLLDSGAIAGLPAVTSSASITIDSGNWPSVTANTNYNIILDVRAADEPAGSTTDNALAVPVVVQNSQVDYAVSGVGSTGTTVAGGTLSGEFTVENTLADAGAVDITWKAYLSTDATVAIGPTDTLVATGSSTPLAGSPASATIPFTGAWRSSPGPYHLKVEISAADDSSATNNVAVSGGLTTTAPDVDYIVSSFTVGATATSGDPITASFMLENQGTAAGGAFVSWSAYLSTDASYDGSDTLVASNIASALGAGLSSVIPITGTWPTSAADYYLIVRLSAVDDIDGSNNTSASSAVSVTTAGVVDYVVTSITANNPTVFVGDTISEFLTVTNIGDVDGNTGSNNVRVDTYTSSDTVLDGGDHLIKSKYLPGLVAGDNRTTDVGWFGTPPETWPTAGTFYLLAEATATDESAAEQANGVSAVGPFVVRPRPDLEASFYSTLPTSGIPGDSTNTQYFRISEVNGADTISNIEWDIYASVDQEYDASDHWIDGGTIAPLTAGDFENISWSGTWPTVGDQYNIIAVISSPDDNNPSNDVGVEPDLIDIASFEFIGTKDTEPNNDFGPTTSTALESSPVGLTGGINADELLILGGSLDAALTLDTYKLVIGTAQSLEVWVEWSSGSDDLELNVWDTYGRSWGSFESASDREPSVGRVSVSGWNTGDIVYLGIEPVAGSGDYRLFVVAK